MTPTPHQEPVRRLAVATTVYECGTRVRHIFGMIPPVIIHTGDAMKKHLLEDARKFNRNRLRNLPAGVVVEKCKKLKQANK